MSKPRGDGARHAHFPDHGLAMDAAAAAPSSTNPSFSASRAAAAGEGRRRPSAPPHPHLLDPPRRRDLQPRSAPRCGLGRSRQWLRASGRGPWRPSPARDVREGERQVHRVQGDRQGSGGEVRRNHHLNGSCGVRDC